MKSFDAGAVVRKRERIDAIGVWRKSSMAGALKRHFSNNHFSCNAEIGKFLFA